MMKILQLKYITIALCFIGFVSCEEVIDVDLDSANRAVVAEGNIELGEPAWLKLSYTTDYFSDIDITYITNSTVYLIDDNGELDTLTYEGNGIYRGKNIVGEANSSYTISMYVHNRGYNATSTLFPSSAIEDVWFREKSSSIFDDDDETKYRIHVVISNDTEQENYYLFRFYVNGELKDDWYTLANSSYYPDNDYLEYSPSRVEFEKEDEVKVYVYSIDENTYSYYEQLNDILESGLGSSSTPYNPQSNFGENILGYFSAWSYDSYDTKVE